MPKNYRAIYEVLKEQARTQGLTVKEVPSTGKPLYDYASMNPLAANVLAIRHYPSKDIQIDGSLPLKRQCENLNHELIEWDKMKGDWGYWDAHLYALKHEKELPTGGNSMGKLGYEQRHKLPKEAFAIPEKRQYPIHDIAHARNALARVSAFGTAEEKAKVRQAVYGRYPELAKEGVIKVHDDGDLTVKNKGQNFVVTTDSKVFRQIKGNAARQTLNKARSLSMGPQHYSKKRGGLTRIKG